MKQETIERIRRFTEDRDWDQFHTPVNLAKSISIEANELLECFQWSDTEYDLSRRAAGKGDALRESPLRRYSEICAGRYRHGRHEHVLPGIGIGAFHLHPRIE